MTENINLIYGADQTRITQTIVIDMLSPLYKAIGVIAGYLTGSRQMWENHFQKELVNLKAQIEQSVPAA